MSAKLAAGLTALASGGVFFIAFNVLCDGKARPGVARPAAPGEPVAARARAPLSRGGRAPAPLAVSVAVSLAPSRVHEDAGEPPPGVSAGPSGENRAAAPAASAPRRAPRPRDPDDATLPPDERVRIVAEVLGGLEDKDPKKRILALRRARDFTLPGIMKSVEPLALGDPDPTVRRFAVQALALEDDPSPYREAFVRSLASRDWTIRANATLGLARTGDEQAQNSLLGLLLHLRATGSPRADGIARALEAPELRAPPVVDYFRSRSTDFRLAREERDHAAAVLAAKEQP